MIAGAGHPTRLGPTPQPADRPDTAAASAAAGVTAAQGDEAHPGSATPNERSKLAQVAATTLIGGYLVRNNIDRARVLVKLPEAHRRGMLSTGVRQLVTGPTTTIIDPTAPRVATAASGWKSFTRLDARMMRAAVTLGTVLTLVRLASASANLGEALIEDGPRDVLTSRSGRTGVAQATLSVIALGMLTRAGVGAWRGGARGIGPVYMQATVSPGLIPPWRAALAFTAGNAVIANELGMLDFLNKGETRSAPQVVRDSLERLPVIGRFLPAAQHQPATPSLKPPAS